MKQKYEKNTIGFWLERIKKMKTQDLIKNLKALEQIDSWKEYKDAYGWTEYDVLITFIKSELEERESMQKSERLAEERAEEAMFCRRN